MKKKLPLLVLGVGILALGLTATVKVIQSREGAIPLAIRWEGLVISHNSRDVGASANDCLGKPSFRPGRLMRANGWFSGWSCSSVGDPDVIYSLNHNPVRNEVYFCRGDGKNLLGRYFNDDIVLYDLEFAKTWEDPVMRRAACGFFNDSFAELAAGKKILVHCDAGRDRTGTYAALLLALTAEARGQLDPAMLDAIECDYRKTRSLTPEKFGRMKAFVEDLARKGGVKKFFVDQCGTSPALLDAVAAGFAG